MGWSRSILRGNLTGVVLLTLLLVSQAFPSAMLFPHVPSQTTEPSEFPPLDHSESGIFYGSADLIPAKAPAIKESHKQTRRQLPDRSVEGDSFGDNYSSNPALLQHGSMEEPSGRYESRSGLLRTLLCVYRL